MVNFHVRQFLGKYVQDDTKPAPLFASYNIDVSDIFILAICMPENKNIVLTKNYSSTRIVTHK